MAHLGDSVRIDCQIQVIVDSVTGRDLVSRWKLNGAAMLGVGVSHKARRGQRGAIAVEFALVFPLLAMLLFGIIQFGFYFFSMQAGSQAVREGARRAAVGDMPTCVGAGNFVDYVTDRVGAASFGNAVTVKRSYHKASGNTDPGVEVGDLVQVDVTFNTVNLHFPLIPVPQGGTVSQSADSRVENVPTAPQGCP